MSKNYQPKARSNLSGVSLCATLHESTVFARKKSSLLYVLSMTTGGAVVLGSTKLKTLCLKTFVNEQSDMDGKKRCHNFLSLKCSGALALSAAPASTDTSDYFHAVFGCTHFLLPVYTHLDCTQGSHNFHPPQNFSKDHFLSGHSGRRN